MNGKIAVIDSGVGGLSVVKEFYDVNGELDIVFFGDNKNVPYGNKNKEEIVFLMSEIFKFLKTIGVKKVFLACNTMSAAYLNEPDKIGKELEIIDILSPTVRELRTGSKRKLGLIATEFTVKSNEYQKRIKKEGRELECFIGSRTLARLIEKKEENMEEIRREIKEINELFIKDGVQELIVGCTHYEMVREEFERLGAFKCVYPAKLMAKEAEQSLRERSGNSKLEIYTTGEEGVFISALRDLGLDKKLGKINLINL